MAEFLVKATNASHSDPTIDQSGCYKRGDIVDVRPDGWPWGEEEGLPRFVIVKVPGLDADAYRYLANPDQDLTGANPNQIRRMRLWKVLVDDVPQGIIDQLRDNGQVTVTVAQIRNFVRNKITNGTL